MNLTREFLLETPDGDLDWHKLAAWGMFATIIVYTIGAGLGFF